MHAQHGAPERLSRLLAQMEAQERTRHATYGT
jgi:hypothetical protein